MGGEICTDNRFEIIAAYKKKLIEGTNIESSPDEMAVIDNILFRFWQMDWLPPIPHGRLIDADALVEDLKRQCEEVFKIDAVSPDDFWITRDQAYNERLWKTWCESFFEYLKTRETIIPESEEG